VSVKIAVAGKGGTGKTTIAGLIIGYLLKAGKAPILAVDADANANLNEVLGLSYQHTIGGVRENLRTEVPEGMTKDVWFELKAQQAVVESRDLDLLVMGRPEGPGCYCVANALARHYIEVLTKNYEYIVIDNEAGMEHFSRLTTHDLDLLFVVSDPSIRGLQTTRRILDLIKELNLAIVRTALVISQLRDGMISGLVEEAARLDLEISAFVPYDEAIFQADLAGTPTFDLPESSPAVQAVGKMLGPLL
jgi:CO dehydrogenase maturation factor